MRQHNKYLEKVYEEMDVYRQHLLRGDELTITQEETFAKMDICRGWLKEGYSDTEVIRMLKNHPVAKIQERRAREVLAMSYEVFAELRQLRNRDGIKYLYAEQFREAAKMAYDVFVQESKRGEDLKAAAALLKEFRGLLKEAATIDGAYDNSKVSNDDKKKPTKIVIKRKTVIQNDVVKEDNLIEEAHYEDVGPGDRSK